MTQPRVLILQATGTNRDGDAAYAVELAGGLPDVLHVNQLRDAPSKLHSYQMLVLPGGFSYGDALGAGRLLAVDMRWLFQDALAGFVEAGKPVIGICNGFQALVKSGWLPGPAEAAQQGRGLLQDAMPPGRSPSPRATLTRNVSNRFECRWVWLRADADSPCVFTKNVTELITCPVAHGEGRFVPAGGTVSEASDEGRQDGATLASLRAHNQIALTYVSADGGPAIYPDNPNGSTADIAGICNRAGNVFGLMPHPEDHVLPWQHPRAARGEAGGSGLVLFERGIHYASQVS
ncbi:MAG: phosphoribosylformylglycinamidine synthase I [Anaerolineae bacterium]